MSTSAGIGKLASPADSAANRVVLVKLVVFSILMALAPILTYFFSLRLLFDGNATFAAIAAVVAANVVLVGYVTIAFREDAAERREVEEKKRLASGGGTKKTN